MRNLIVGFLLGGAVLMFALTKKEVLQPHPDECWPLIIGMNEYVACLHEGKLQTAVATADYPPPSQRAH